MEDTTDGTNEDEEEWSKMRERKGKGRREEDEGWKL